MATDNSDKTSPDSNSGKKSADGMSMKERLLAARKADAEGAAPAGAPPVPAARPVARPASATPTPAAKPAATPAPSARPAAKSMAPASVSPASEAPTRKPVKLAGAREEERALKSGAKKQVSEDVRREIEMLRKNQDKWITYGWIVAGALLLIAGVTYYITSSHKKAIDDAEKARQDRVARWISDIKGIDAAKPADWAKFEAMLADPANTEPRNSNTGGARELTARLGSTIQQNKERIQEQVELLKGIVEIEQIATEAGSKSAEDLSKARRRLTLYQGQTETLGVENGQRVTKAGTLIDRAFVAKLHEEAKAAGAKGPAEAKAALAVYTKAEDEIIKLLNDATKKRLEEVKEYYIGHYREMITEADLLSAIVFTPDAIEKVAWLDLLSGEQKDKWQRPGFTGWELKDGVIKGNTELASRSTAIMSIGDAEQWREYVLELEFAVLKGDAQVHYRLGASVNNASINIPLATTGNSAFKPGQAVTMTTSIVGSTLKYSFTDPDHSPSEEILSWSTNRKGGIGLSVPPGCDIKVTKMRVRPLR
ncbi:MAG: hypothetical protein SGI72_14860 [Planctomycetota bacterium]|nr:hypothetical protein [Planctomycetota bacterium]